jgi:hypothetical protein
MKSEIIADVSMLVAVARRKDFATAARTKPRLEAELDVSRRWDGKAIAVVMIERRQSATALFFYA